MASMAIDEPQFDSLLEQVRDLHRIADELTRSPRLIARINSGITRSMRSMSLS